MTRISLFPLSNNVFPSFEASQKNIFNIHIFTSVLLKITSSQEDWVFFFSYTFFFSFRVLNRIAFNVHMLLNCGVGEDYWESLGMQGNQTSCPKRIQSWIFLGGLMLKLKLQYFSHLMRRADSLEKTLKLGKGRWERERRRSRWQRTRWLDGITNSMNMSLSKLWETMKTEKPSMLQFMGSQRDEYTDQLSNKQQFLSIILSDIITRLFQACTLKFLQPPLLLKAKATWTSLVTWYTNIKRGTRD